MVRGKVESLYNKTLSLVTQKFIKDTVNHHLENCVICAIPRHVENCPEMKKMKEHFSNLPSSILNSIYTELERQHSYTRRPRSDADLMYVYTWLLENPELSINFKFYNCDDNSFLIKFGKYIRSIEFAYQYIFKDQIHNRFDGFFWKTVLFSARNIQVLDLSRCYSTTAEVFEYIGLECLQIKVINNIQSAYVGLTVDKLRKLCFRQFQNSEIKNNCCNTLQQLDLPCSENSVSFIENFSQTLKEIVPVLLENIPGLKYFGRSFEVDYYLRSIVVSPQDIKASRLEKISICHHEVSEGLLPLLQKFCPKMNFLKVEKAFDKSFQHLHQYFPNLENLTVQQVDKTEEIPVCKIITESVWSKLNQLKLTCQTLDVELSDFARSLPNLEILKIINCTVEWNGRSGFKNLKKVYFQFSSKPRNTLWIASFSDSIHELYLTVLDENEGLNKNICSSLLTIPLPKLKLLSLDYLEYDYVFITGILVAIPSLKRFFMDSLTEYDLLDDVYAFAFENNYDWCFLTPRSLADA